jgi:hypothetical protein
VAQVTSPLSGLPRISSVFTGLVYGNPHVWAIIVCLAITYGALMFRPGAEFARNNLRTSPGVLLLGYTVPAGIWGDTAVFRPETTLGSMFGMGWLILQQLLQAFAALSLIHELPWKASAEGLDRCATGFGAFGAKHRLDHNGQWSVDRSGPWSRRIESGRASATGTGRPSASPYAA